MSSTDFDHLFNFSLTTTTDSDHLSNLSPSASSDSGFSSDSVTTFSRNGLVEFLSNNFISFEQQGLSSFDLILDAVRKSSRTIPALKKLSNFRKLDLMLQNIKVNLHTVARFARQSGLYHAILGASVGDGIEPADLSEVFGVDLRTAKKTFALFQAKKLHLENTGKHLPFLQKPTIRRLRMAPEVLQRIESFFRQQCTPSADKSKKKRRRIAPKTYEERGVMYRTEKLSKMLSLYRVFHFFDDMLIPYCYLYIFALLQLITL